MSYLLHDHPSIVSIGETFCTETIWGNPAKPYFDNNWSLMLYRNVFPTGFLRSQIFHSYPKAVKAVGFRIFYHHFIRFPSVLGELVKLPTLKIIHLKRRNLLQNYVSLKVANITNHWSSKYRFVHSKPKITLTYTECLEHFTGFSNEYSAYESRFRAHDMLEVFYENLVNNKENECNKILRFLGVRYKNLHQPLIKQETRPLKKVIRNYTVLKKQFAHTPWYAYFTDNKNKEL